MNSTKYIPDFLGECRLGTYYVSAFHSLRTDNDYKTIWLDLETKKGFFTYSSESDYKFPIIRKSLGKKEDFGLFLNNKFLPLFNLFQANSIPIPVIVDFILNPEKLGQENQYLISQILELRKNFSDEDKKELLKFSQFVQNLRKEPLPKLLDDKKYSLLFGNLNFQERIDNKVLTEKNPELKRINITEDDIHECFGNIILSDSIFNNVFSALGLKDIFADPPQLPKSGGAIFIDMGGTGKSLMKAGLKAFWKKIGGECIEKNGIAEFGHDTNYARLIGSWYFGYDEKGYDKVGLFNLAVKNKVPSLLIIDEADRFVKSSNNEYKDESADLIITEFKKYLNERDKGGVFGYVITLFIANVAWEDLNPQLRQGDSRLTPVYFGPPNDENEWLDLIDIYFNECNFQFKERSKKDDSILANLILIHNKCMNNEIYKIPPRKFSDFCKKYLSKYYKEERKREGETRVKKIFASLFSKNNVNMVINYKNFLEHFIDDLLLNEVKLSKGNVSYYKNLYYKYINNENQEDSEEKAEFDEFKEIFEDIDTLRIMFAKKYFEIFSNDKILSNEEVKVIWRVLLFKYRGDKEEEFVEFNGKKCTGIISKSLVKDIYFKVLSANPSKITDLDSDIDKNDTFDINKYLLFYEKYK